MLKAFGLTDYQDVLQVDFLGMWRRRYGRIDRCLAPAKLNPCRQDQHRGERKERVPQSILAIDGNRRNTLDSSFP